MKSPHEARPTSTPKAVSCKGGMKCPPMSTKRCTPTAKTQPKLYNKTVRG